MLSIKDAATALHITRMQVWRMIKRGEIPAEQVGKTWIIKELPQEIKQHKPGRKPQHKEHQK